MPVQTKLQLFTTQEQIEYAVMRNCFIQITFYLNLDEIPKNQNQTKEENKT
jgi:hypothetical protein